jgi:septum formation protein
MNKFNQNFILASGSARRIALLEQIGITPDLIVTPNIDEKINLKELPIDYVKRMANEKNIIFQANYPKSIILSADTIVTIGRRILPKAINIQIAEACLKKLSGRRHKVYTSFALSSPNNRIRIKTVQSIVKFKRLDKNEIARYINSNEWQDKAGGYAIQGMAASLINFISGSYSNIVGLPLAELYRTLVSIDYKFNNDK